MAKIIVLIDGGHLRVHAKKANLHYDPNFIEKFALHCKQPDEEILRILYYDCAQFAGTVALPISGQPFTSASSDAWLKVLHRQRSLAQSTFSEG